MIRYVWCLILIKIHAGVNPMNCPSPDIKFEKVLGLRPPNTSHPLLLYKLEKGVPPRPITSECIAKCHSNEDCRSFDLRYSAFECYWYRQEIIGMQETENVIDDDAAWFIKVCLKESSECGKLWHFERIPGAVLIGNDTKIIPNPISRTDCQQLCLNETDFLCRSVKFRLIASNYSPNIALKGRCILSNADRHLLPNSYRVSGYDEEYFENQCLTNPLNDGSVEEFCAYEEYDNVTLAHADILFERKSKDDCQKHCEELLSFNCRGFSIISNNICLLHSEDSKIHGPKILKGNIYSHYYEKARCLDITVACSQTDMTVSYDPEVDFFGKVYMQGYSENPECYAVGQGKFKTIILKLALLTSKCGIYKANGHMNRTLLSGTMVIQYNSIIQTQGDRIIKVGCIFGGNSTVLIGTGVKITTAPGNKGSTLNSSSNTSSSPMVQMRIVDLNTHEEISDSQIGQELELIIEYKVQNSSYDIWASHLIAMTERSDESIFLLDDRGCPTDLNVFPPLEKVPSNTSRQLVAAFQAFKFASSPIVRFSVIIQFCPNECPPIQCERNIVSYGRRKREVVSKTINTINGTTVVKINRTEFEERSGVVNQMPLEYIMVVRDSKSFSDKLIFGDNKILVAGYDYTTNEVCMDYSLVVGLIITWMLIQVFFIIGCIMLVKRYKRYYQHECTRHSLEELHKNFGIGFSNLENRRVHWADSDNIL